MADEKTDLTSLVAEQSETIKALTNRLDKLENPSDSVSRKPYEAPKYPPPEKTFKRNKTEYRFRVGKYIGVGGVRMMAKDALNNQRELDRLVQIKSGIIEEVK